MLDHPDALVQALEATGCNVTVKTFSGCFRVEIGNGAHYLPGTLYRTRARAIYASCGTWKQNIERWQELREREYAQKKGVSAWGASMMDW